MKNLTTILTTILVLSLTACQTTDPVWDAEQDLQTNEVNVDQLEKENIDKVQYLARDLMASKERKILTQRLSNEASTWDHTSVTAGFVGATVLTGNPFSGKGSTMSAGIMMGLDALNFVFDGAADDIAKYWMPNKTVEGDFLSVEEATIVSREKVREVLNNTYSAMGIALFCTDGCASNDYISIYRADLSEGTIADLKSKYGYIYVPKTIQVVTTLAPLHEIKEEDAIESLALGFKPAYVSGYNGFRIHAFSGVNLDEQGNEITLKAKVENTSATEIEYFSTKYKMIESQFGRDVNRKISRQLPLVQGGTTYNKHKYITYNGEMYKWYVARDNRFIDAKVLN